MSQQFPRKNTENVNKFLSCFQICSAMNFHKGCCNRSDTDKGEKGFVQDMKPLKVPKVFLGAAIGCLKLDF